MYPFVAKFHCCKWPKLKTKSSHLVILLSRAMHFYTSFRFVLAFGQIGFEML